MTDAQHEQDLEAIQHLIAREFASVTWTEEREADWSAFAADFLADAPLFPASRPVEARSVPKFLTRMKALPNDGLTSFEQSLCGTKIMLFGNAAVAFSVCENLKNRSTAQRGIEAFLLVKDGSVWRIAAQAWDIERDGLSVPEEFLE